MKRLILFIILLVSNNTSFAQADSLHVWNKWCARKDTMLLFTGGNNVIQIYSTTRKPGDIKLKCLDKSLRIGIPEIKGDTLSVMAMPFPAKGSKMRLAILDKKTSREIKTISFSCDSIPPLVARIGKLLHAEAPKKDILAQTMLKLELPHSLYSYPYSIKQYTFKIATAKGSATIPVKGFFITNDILKEINAAPVGTVVEFTDIKATCPECATRTLPDIKLRIK
jgi:hypothetical protein